MELTNHKDNSLNIIVEQLKDKSLSPQLRKQLEMKKDILLNNKTVKK